MRTPLTILILVTSLAVSGAVRADEDCTVPMAEWQPRVAVQQMAEAQGWTVRRIKIDDGCYEIDASDAEGRAIEVKVDPSTLAIMGFEFEE
jgi:hypothetical protein